MKPETLTPIRVEQSETERIGKNTIRRIGSIATTGAIESPTPPEIKSLPFKIEKVVKDLEREYKKKDGIEVLLPDSSGMIDFMEDNGPNHNLAIVCNPNSFPIFVTLKKRGDDLNTYVYGQEFSDLSENERLLKASLEDFRSGGYEITKVALAVPNGTDTNADYINGSIRDKILNTFDGFETPNNRIEKIIADYDSQAATEGSGVVFKTEISYGGHSTTTKLGDKEVSSPLV